MPFVSVQIPSIAIGNRSAFSAITPRVIAVASTSSSEGQMPNAGLGVTGSQKGPAS